MIYRFGPFELDAERYALRADGEAVDVEPRVLEALVHLVRHRDRVVGKDELVDEVWGGKHVTDAALTRAVAEARRALGDTAAESRWIRTVYGRGFAFAGEVEEVAAAAGEPARPLAAAGLPVPVSSLIGREEEIAAVADLLEAARLVTLTGPAGTGKTRLALEVARRVAGRHAAGAAFVPLAEVDEPARLPQAVLRALSADGSGDADPFRRLVARLSDHRLLLVLDNFEHLAPAAPRLAELLRACPRLTVLATSRFVLHVEGEREVPVPPLAVRRGDGPADGDDAAPGAAVTLFLERARAADPGFDPDAEALSYVGELCRRLDGLPLAIELAAPWVKLLPSREIWSRLARRLDLLSARGDDRPLRHSSLAAALAWSHQLLGDEERVILRRLGAFAGAFGLEAVAAVVADDAEGEAGDVRLLERLGALVDKSLVEPRSGRDGGRRFALLETTRRFALERLAEAGEETATRRRHARWLADLARRAEPEIAAGDQQTWLARLDDVTPEIATALAWCRRAGDDGEGGDAAAADLATGLELAAAVARYHSARGTYREGEAELARLLAHPAAAEAPPAVRAAAANAHGMLLHLLADYAAALPRLEEALALYREMGDRRGTAAVLNHLAWVLAQVSRLDRAEELAGEAVELHRREGDRRGEAVAWNDLAWIAMFRDDWATAEERWRRDLALRRAVGEDRGTAFALLNLSLALRHVGGPAAERRAEAWRNLAEAAEIVERLGDRPQIAWVRCVEGAWHLDAGELDRALECLQAGAEQMGRVDQADGRAWALLYLADVHAERGEAERARACLRECREIWRPRGHRWGVEQSEARLARLDG